MNDFDLEMRQAFLDEAEDLLDNAETSFLALEEDRSDRQRLDEIFRLAHNLKGSARAVGFGHLAEMTHAAENILLKMKSGEVEISEEVITVLLEFKDKVAECVQILRDDSESEIDVKDTVELLNRTLENALAGSGESESQDTEETAQTEENEPEETVESESAENDDGFGSGLHLFEEEDLREKAEAVRVSSNVTPMDGLKKKPKKQPVRPKTSDDETIRVNLSRIDMLNNIIGELVILQTVIQQRRYKEIHDEVTNASVTQMSKLFKEAQRLSMSLRMLPLKATFQKMNRIVRDVSKSVNKEVDFETIGERTEVDKTVIEKISDPLVHIIRNAVDHGIEDSQGRKASGKSPKGKVTLAAYHEGSNLVVEIKDDGKGINPEIIHKKAAEKGVISASANLSPDQVIQLIFHPGFSTAEQLSEVSGRGVGMDVVKTNVQELGGNVRVSSEVGVGSTFKIVLPLTLAITDGMVFASGPEKYVIPMTQIYEITRVLRKEINSFSGGGKLFRLRGEVLPLFDINSKLGNKTSLRDMETVIIVRKDESAYGVTVEDVLHQQQIVIKELGEELSGKEGIMGSAILGDGKPAFILDLVELFGGEIERYRRSNSNRRAG